MLSHRFFLGEGVKWQELQVQMLHNFPFLGLKVISWKFLSFQDLRVLCTWPLESISRAYSLSFFLCYRPIHIDFFINSHEFFVCFLVFGLLGSPPLPPFVALFCCPCWEIVLQKARVSTPQVILKQQPDFSKNTKSNVFGSSSLSSCKLQNFPNIVYRIIAKGIRP